MRKGIVFVAAAFLSACAGEVDDLPLAETDATAAGIIGGTIDEGDPAVAMLQITRGDASVTCTASVIAPKVLLTAAHCVQPGRVQGATLRAFFGTDSRSEEETWVNVKETHFDPEYDHADIHAGHDIAVAILEEPVAIQPLPYNRAPMTEDMAGEPVRLIGFGDDDEIFGWSGVKHHVSTIVNTVTPLLLGLGDAGHHTCQGDSGGPALMDMNGVPTIVGVTSFGNASAPRICTDGWDTRVDLYLDFIDQFVNAP
ncbi:trypsin-like serine protease [Sorangium sp. So ce1014]|uniref:S1 family peptidase n=1 Tax=Sorangium sp. So ce1014 TaxID=3133326 RepID=UPI003F6184CF